MFGKGSFYRTEIIVPLDVSGIIRDNQETTELRIRSLGLAVGILCSKDLEIALGGEFARVNVRGLRGQSRAQRALSELSNLENGCSCGA